MGENNFHVECAPDRSTMIRFMKQRQETERPTEHHRLTEKSNCAGAIVHLESALYLCICTKNKNRVILKGELIKLYITKLLDESNKHLQDGGRIQLNFSKG